MTMFMVGCQIIGLDEEFSKKLPSPIHVSDIIEYISLMISFVYMCELPGFLFFFVFAGLCTGQYDIIMRCCNSSLGQGSLQSYNLSFIVICVYPDSHVTLVPIVATTQSHSPTQVLLISNPLSQIPDLCLPSPASQCKTPSPCRILLLASYASAKVDPRCGFFYLYIISIFIGKKSVLVYLSAILLRWIYVTSVLFIICHM